jgi:mRNA-degrading endonuclease RelE of RelBE toxin-antitoxin system
MTVEYSDAVAEALEKAPDSVKRAFFKQVKLLEQNLRHPSLRAKKYDEAQHRWQARVNKGWRFYFTIANDRYQILKLIPHPKK